MSALVKTKVKAARDAIGKKDYEKARDLALGALEYEPNNYLAYVCSASHILQRLLTAHGTAMCSSASRISTSSSITRASK